MHLKWLERLMRCSGEHGYANENDRVVVNGCDAYAAAYQANIMKNKFLNFVFLFSPLFRLTLTLTPIPMPDAVALISMHWHICYELIGVAYFV